MAYKEVRRFGNDASTRFFQGLAADTEPTESAFGKIPEGSILLILDTKAVKTYHEENATWYTL
jgi:hypothetical protein